jgi:hypothetical protein
VLDDWTTALAQTLGIDVDVQAGPLLDVARDAAHNVARPAAPLTTFLIGVAVAQRGGGPEALADACRQASELALGWDSPDSTGGPDPAAS